MLNRLTAGMMRGCSGTECSIHSTLDFFSLPVVILYFVLMIFSICPVTIAELRSLICIEAVQTAHMNYALRAVRSFVEII